MHIMRVLQGLREIHYITKLKEGAVWETDSLGEFWVDFEDTEKPADYIYAALSTSRTQELLDKNQGTTRGVSEERAGFSRSLRPPCEICSGPHPTWECCEICNHASHTCHFCGETLGHSERGHCDPED